MIDKRKNDLIKNTLILSIGLLGSKILSLLLIPLYTFKLLPEDYGKVDMLQSITNLLIPIITLQLGSAIFRFLITETKIEQKRVIISSSFIVVILNIIASIFFILLFHFFMPIPYIIYFIFLIATCCLFNIFIEIIRGLSHTVEYSFFNFFLVSLSAILNILFIYHLGMQGDAILLAAIIANTITILLILKKINVSLYISRYCFRKDILTKLCAYSSCLIPNAVSWWIVNTSSRLLIVYYCGAYYNGIFAIANKIPAIYNNIYMVYILALTESIAKVMTDNDKEKYIQVVSLRSFKILSSICILVISFISVFFDFIIGSQFSDSYIHILLLMLANWFCSIAAIYGAVFTAYMDSKTVGLTTLYGALISILINLLFISNFGLYAASISSLVAYFVILTTRRFYIFKMLKHNIFDYDHNIIYLLILTSIIYVFASRNIKILTFIAICLWFLYTNKEIIKSAVNKIYNRF